MTGEKRRGAAFIDRDGTINVEVNYLHEPEKAVILPGVAEALDLIHAHNYLAVVVTNQAGIAKGMYGEAVMRRAASLEAESLYDWIGSDLHSRKYAAFFEKYVFGAQ